MVKPLINETIPSRIDAIPGFIARLLTEFEVLFHSEDDIINVRLAVEEAIVNAIRHGNKLNPDLPVEIVVVRNGREIVVTVRDQGNGFDFNNINDPTQSDNLMKTSGRGIFLIRKLMDHVEFLDGGRGIRMTKSLKEGSRP